MVIKAARFGDAYDWGRAMPFEVELPSLEIGLALGSAAIALVSLLLNWRLVRQQARREIEGLRLQRDAELIKWADDTIDTLAAIQMLLRDRARLISSEVFLARRSQLRTQLSAVIDRGRLFFPSAEAHDEAGNETAYSGDDDPVIAALNKAQNVLKQIDLTRHEYDRDTVLALVAARRQFVSRVFDAVDPRRRRNVFRTFDRDRL